jgi:uncharacterized protein YceK
MKYLLIVLLLSGCGSVQPKLSPPVDVSLIPNDCVNQERIVRWLESQSKGEWNEHVAQIRARIWHIRYSCNLV